MVCERMMRASSRLVERRSPHAADTDGDAGAEERMGIVAYCPQGHRVKVKDQLAGKKGLCPVCGTRFRIPAASDPANDLSYNPAAAVAESEQRAHAPVAGRSGVASDAAAFPSARILALDPAIVATLPRATAWDVAAVAAPPAPEAPVVPAATNESAAPPRRPLHPVIAEREDMAWSIALPGGEPSAPLPADTMQDWLDARQATGDEVVWRADWPQWLPVRQVFPDCFA
jgi:hypothetical protein